MIPESFKMGTTIYVFLPNMGVISKYIYEGDGIFHTHNGREDLNGKDWSQLDYSFSEDHAQCKAYIYKLNQLHKQLDEANKKIHQTQLSINSLNNTFGHLKKKFPEEFV